MDSSKSALCDTNSAFHDAKSAFHDLTHLVTLMTRERYKRPRFPPQTLYGLRTLLREETADGWEGSEE